MLVHSLKAYKKLIFLILSEQNQIYILKYSV